MIQELLYTSHEGRGLRQGGGGGFCTVLSTEGMASNLAAALEKLSGYKHPFDIHDPRSLHNPINFRHAIIRIGGANYHVLSRIADLRGEHTGRSNKLAHHIVLASADLAAAGPTKLLMHQGFCRDSWDGRVRLVAQKDPPALPAADFHAKHCRYWQQITGDAGWAGYIAEQLLATPNPTISVIFPLGTDALALTDEVFSLIPSDKRWNFTFSTYYAVAPPITSCHLRFVLNETSDAEQLRRDYRQVVIDLSDISRDLPESALVAAARTGVAPKNDLVQTPAASPAFSPEAGVSSRRISAGSPDTADSTAPIELSFDTGDYEVLPPAVRGNPMSTAIKSHATTILTLGQQRTLRKRRIRKWIVATCITVAGACLITIATILVILGSKQILAGRGKTKSAQAAKPNSTSAAKQSPPVPVTTGETQNTQIAKKPRPDQINVSGANPQDSGLEQSLDANPLPQDLNAKLTKNVAIQDRAEPQPSEAAESQSTNLAVSAEPKLLIPKQVLPIPKVTSPPKKELLDTVQLQLSSNKLELTGIDLIGFDWFAHEWKTNDNHNELEARPDPNAGTLQIVRKQSGLHSEILLCEWTFKDNALTFAWKQEAMKQIIGVEAPKKAWLLNGLKWCVLKLSTGSGHEYIRLSKPAANRVQLALFPYLENITTISSVLPANIKTKLEILDGSPPHPVSLHKTGEASHKVVIYRDDFGGEMSSTLKTLKLTPNDSYEWHLETKTILSVVNDQQQTRSVELNTDAQIDAELEQLLKTARLLQFQADHVNHLIGNLEKPPAPINSKGQKSASEEHSKLLQKADLLAKKKDACEQLKAHMDSFRGRLFLLSCQLEYLDGDQLLIVPILNDEGSVNGQRNAPERFQ